MVTVDICGKRTLEYFIDCLGKFNRDDGKVSVRATGGNFAKGVRVAQILSSEFDEVAIERTHLQPIEINKVPNLMLEILLACRKSSHKSQNTSARAERMKFKENEFVSLPNYHLMLDALLFNNKSFEVSFRNGGKSKSLLSVFENEGSILCKSTLRPQKAENVLTELAEVYYRTGIVMSPHSEQVVERLTQFDDVVIGVDTNILYDAILSEHILSTLSLLDSVRYLHTPNWMLIVVPSAVLHELERASNHRNKKGRLNRVGRLAYRAIQEIIELGQSKDLQGINLIIYGGANPMLDTTAELKGLRRDLLDDSNMLFSHLSNSIQELEQIKMRLAQSASKEAGAILETEKSEGESKRQARKLKPRSLIKASSGDTIIRDQFKHFLRQIDLHKGGIFFLTADKTNAVLTQAEGLFPLYHKVPAHKKAASEVKLKRIRFKNNGRSDDIIIPVPVGKLIYELAVQFGEIIVSWDKGEKEVYFSCDNKGESLDHWIFKDLAIRGNKGIESLSEIYSTVGKLPLKKVSEVCNRLCDSFTSPKMS